MEFSSCGVGFVANLKQEPSHQVLKNALRALCNVEHRGGSDRGGLRGDGAGVMTCIPWNLLNREEGKYGVATLFAPQEEKKYRRSLEVFEAVFASFELIVDGYREVPLNENALDSNALSNRPRIIQAFIKKPKHCRTLASFDELMYLAKQMVRSKQKDAGIKGEFFFSSLSSRSIVYKALATSFQLESFYPDLSNPDYKTNFALFHRRYSTNTLPSWDKVQPFRLIAHNGEINTIEGNKEVAFSRETAIGLRRDQILTHEGTSDSGNLNGMVEALKYRSSIPHLSEIMAIMIPPANSSQSDYYRFWSRAMEPWDGPALVAYSDGKRIGARLDRNGFRPCRWSQTDDSFYLCSEAGAFDIPAQKIRKSGVLYAGRSVSIHLFNGEISFKNPDQSEYYKDAQFDSRLHVIEFEDTNKLLDSQTIEKKLALFNYSKENLDKELYPMIDHQKEPIGSMGDTARLFLLSRMHRSLYDCFFQSFSQVTNPPLDYLRERMVTDLSVNLGRQPNIFDPKELIPAPRGVQVPSPILSLGQLESIIALSRDNPQSSFRIRELCLGFDRHAGVEGFSDKIDKLTKEAVNLVKNSTRILVLSDRNCSYEKPAIPALLVMRAIQLELNKQGIRLRVSIVVDSAEAFTSHQIAVLLAFGASAVCPYLALNIARARELEGFSTKEREMRLIKALEDGLLKVMAKRGISVVRSYQGSELFTIIGLDERVLARFFPRHRLSFGGLKIEGIVDRILKRPLELKEGKLPNFFLYKEHGAGRLGEGHSLTSKRSRTIHKLLDEPQNSEQAKSLWAEFTEELEQQTVNLRDLLTYKNAPIALEKVCSLEEILPRFGSGAMSFGSISAESQRDIILAFRQTGGRSNSGEGGENPFYFSDGITAKVKQIASGRFGVTAEYLATGDEVQIKIAQGAKPGEGGQLMGVKVNEAIAKARFSNTNVDLISPPPQHDIYSIEDLAQLIYEIKQIKKGIKVSVKLVSDKNIGAIAVGVVKAGADAIQISGGSGGTGAAGLMSMKHAGLAWEYGLFEVHRQLCLSGLRQYVCLRTDGGLLTGADVIKAALLGAEEYDFGKLLLVSQGCIMARICEKNTCPTGIATQDPKFKARYKGRVEKIVKLLSYLAQDVREHLAKMGFTNLKEIIGRNDLLEIAPAHQSLVEKLNINLDYFFTPTEHELYTLQYQSIEVSQLNKQLLEEYRLSKGGYQRSLPISSVDRAVGVSLAGEISTSESKKDVELEFLGSAGQGFAAFNCDKMNVRLLGEANDGVAKSMSGGRVTIAPHPDAQIDPHENVLVGNACLYGATGGVFYLNGLAGDRFCVRNSGARAVCLGAGLHACEYMTRGVVVLLGTVLDNLGAGMTGGVIYTLKENIPYINKEYIHEQKLQKEDKSLLKELLEDFKKQTSSLIADKYTKNLDSLIKLVAIKSS